jgi:hypothetical protein
MNALAGSDAETDHDPVLDQLEAHLRGELGCRVLDLTLERHGLGLVLRGRTHTYYAKQLAQHALMEATDLPIFANEIEVV